MSTRTLFEAELHRRGVAFSIDSASGRHAIETGDGRMLVCLDNLERDILRDGDNNRIARFVDSICCPAAIASAPPSTDRLYWCLERNDYEEPADFRVAVSGRVDRVLVDLSPDDSLITWVTPQMLATLGISACDAADKGFANLGRALIAASIHVKEIDGVPLGYISATLPFKSSLILAPNLREIAEGTLGWPLMAVVPDRDFLYLWAARHSAFVQRVGGVVVREFSQASYPMSTEVYEITEQTIQAIGEFPTGARLG